MNGRNEPIFNVAARCTAVLNVNTKLLLHSRQGSEFSHKRDRPGLSFENMYSEPKKYTQEILNKICFHSPIHLIFACLHPKAWSNMW